MNKVNSPNPSNVSQQTRTDDTKSIHQNITALRSTLLDAALVPLAGELVHPFLEALDDTPIFTPPDGEKLSPAESMTSLLEVVKRVRIAAETTEAPNDKFLKDMASEIERLVNARDSIRRT